ncbi:MAG: TolC family protein, partial [Planctomycetia bacterium]|nr:TolC family protein [Planctomycetia bacterium]
MTRLDVEVPSDGTPIATREVAPASFVEGMPTSKPMKRLPPVDPSHGRTGAMTLLDAIGLGLRNSDIVRVSEGRIVTADPSTVFDVGEADARVLAALAEFDASWATEFSTASSKQPPNAFFGPGLTPLPNERDTAALRLGVDKRWQTGAQAAVRFNPDPTYLYVPQSTSSRFNPSYVGELEISVRQPVLKGAGWQVNRAPIQIASIESEQSAWEFKKAVMASMRSITAAYWELHATHVALQSIDEVIPLIEEVVRLQEESYKAEWVIYADVAKAYAQLHEFRQRRLELQSAAVESELQLRNLLGLPPADGWNIVPIDEPHSEREFIDAGLAVAQAMSYQPDLVRQRLDTRIRDVELLVARNGLQPNLDFQALYRMNGVGQRLDSALRQMYSAEYGDWLVGFLFSVPLGNRQASANARAAELQLARANGLLRQETLTVIHRVSDDIREIDFSFQEYEQSYKRLQAASDWLHGSRLRYQNPRPGSEPNWLLQSLNDYLAALRFRTEAATDAAATLAKYNIALVRLEETKGTLLESLNVHLAADPCQQAVWLGDMEAPVAVPLSAPPMLAPSTATTYAGGGSSQTHSISSPLMQPALLAPSSARQQGHGGVPNDRISLSSAHDPMRFSASRAPSTTLRTPAILAPS